MIRVSHLLLAAATAATLVGCGYPETKMEEVGQPQIQTQKTPPPAPAATIEARNDLGRLSSSRVGMGTGFMSVQMHDARNEFDS